MEPMTNPHGEIPRFIHIAAGVTFWLYGLLDIAACLFVYFLVPETTGRSLEEIEAHWHAGKDPRAIGT